jgi:hypothetical protein
VFKDCIYEKIKTCKNQRFLILKDFFNLYNY